MKAGGSREQKPACADDEDSNGSRHALAVCETLGSHRLAAGHRHPAHRRHHQTIVNVVLAANNSEEAARTGCSAFHSEAPGRNIHSQQS